MPKFQILCQLGVAVRYRLFGVSEHGTQAFAVARTPFLTASPAFSSRLTVAKIIFADVI
jgi:hypothetical protein